MHKPLIIAHRGDSSRALENSLEAFRLALALPVDMIEFDIRKSRDNQLYVMHDHDTGRTAEKNINIEESLSEEIASVKLKNGELIPILSDVLKLVAGKVGLNIEVKSEGSGALTAAHLAGSGYKGPVLISSFKEREVLDARRVMPTIPVSGIFDTFVLSEVNKYRSMGYSFISLKKKTVTRELVSACHDQKIKVYVWTVDEEEEIKRFIEWGVDGIYSNKPMVLKKVVDGLSWL
jgi:glycerophosphoryl diester phosphodiesterase